MKKVLIPLVFLGFCLIFSSCTFFKISDENKLYGDEKTTLKAEGEPVSKVYDLKSFSAIDCSIVCDIIYTQGSDRVEIKAPENVLEKIEVDVDEGGLLNVSLNGYKYRDNRGKNKITLLVSSTVLDNVTIRGAADFSAPEGIRGETFSFEIKGAGDADIDGLEVETANFGVKGAGDISVERLNCKSLSLVVSGAGDCEFSGSAEAADINVSGAGDVDISELNTSSLQTNISGVGTIHRPDGK